MKFGWPTPPYNWQKHQSNYITLDVYSADVDFSQTIKTPSAKWFTGAARAKLSPDMTDEHFPFASLRLPTSPISWARSSGGNLDRMDGPLGRGRPRGNRENRMRGNRQKRVASRSISKTKKYPTSSLWAKWCYPTFHRMCNLTRVGQWSRCKGVTRINI